MFALPKSAAELAMKEMLPLPGLNLATKTMLALPGLNLATKTMFPLPGLNLATKAMFPLPALNLARQAHEDWLSSIKARVAASVSLHKSEMARITESLGVSDAYMTNLRQQCVGTANVVGMQQLAVRLSKVGLAHDAFLADTAKALASTTEVALRGALLKSIALSDSQIGAASRSLMAIGEPEYLSDPMPEPCDLNLPWIQQEELSAMSDESEEAPSTTTAIDVREAINAALRCDDQYQLTREMKLFRATNRTTFAANELSFIVVTDETLLGIFCDHLYFMFYEGAGGGNLRYLSKHGGVLELEECDFLWRLKHLRNFWLRHDVEHGSEGEIEKKRRELRTDLAYYGLGRKPESRDEYRSLQTAIVADMTEFIKTLKAALQRL